MTSDSNAPGAPAIYLYRQVDRDDALGEETNYVRLKILTAEGLKYASVEIPFSEGFESIHDIEARVIRPDGTANIFRGSVSDKAIGSARGVRQMAKSFTLPDVQVGSVVEYRYVTYYKECVRADACGFAGGQSHLTGTLNTSQWVLSKTLFTRKAQFSLRTLSAFSVRWNLPAGLPGGAKPPKVVDGGGRKTWVGSDDTSVIRMDVEAVPAISTSNPTEYTVRFVYSWD